jgi:hypothetical protein
MGYRGIRPIPNGIPVGPPPAATAKHEDESPQESCNQWLESVERSRADGVGEQICETPNEATPPGQVPDGVDIYLEHETRFELLEGSAFSPSRWQGDARRDFIEDFRLNRSYRVVSINSGGNWGR